MNFKFLLKIIFISAIIYTSYKSIKLVFLILKDLIFKDSRKSVRIEDLCFLEPKEFSLMCSFILKKDGFSNFNDISPKEDGFFTAQRDGKNFGIACISGSSSLNDAICILKRFSAMLISDNIAEGILMFADDMAPSDSFDEFLHKIKDKIHYVIYDGTIICQNYTLLSENVPINKMGFNNITGKTK